MLEVQIQVQDTTGNWRTVAVTENVAQLVRARMQEAAWRDSSVRVRAITTQGVLVDML